ncbi:MAG: glutathione S-transferase family protein [Hyphomonadaceae bacterium]|nr:glutathione S-transferase family protein [Hyphomonadaceae bacterium]
MSYRLFGAETSAYSTKMRSYLKYKAFAFDWVPRTLETEDELKRVSRFGTLPVLVTSSGFAVHDTTPMMEALEADSPEPSATPADPALAFLACVLEEHADVWLAKAAYHYRWTRKKDQRLAAQRSIEEYYPSGAPGERKATEDLAIETMTGQLKTMQLDGDLGPVVEKSFKKFIKLLDDHLKKHLFIFGDRPSIADFAIAGQLIQMMKDPTPAKIIEKDGEFVAKWCEFMSAPTASGPFAALDDLKETLAPIFADDLAAFFLPWAAENLESSLAGAETFPVTLGKDTLTLAPLRSAARSFRELRRKFVTGQAIEALKAFTDETATTAFLQRPPRQEAKQDQRPPRTETPEGETAEDEATEASEAGAEQPRDGESSDEASRKRKRRRRRRGGRNRGEGGEGESASADAGSDQEGDDNASGDDAGPDDAGEDAVSAASEDDAPDADVKD